MNSEKSSAPLNVYADPLIDKVRSSRKAISELFNHDSNKTYEHFREVEGTCQEYVSIQAIRRAKFLTTECTEFHGVKILKSFSSSVKLRALRGRTLGGAERLQEY